MEVAQYSNLSGHLKAPDLSYVPAHSQIDPPAEAMGAEQLAEAPGVQASPSASAQPPQTRPCVEQKSAQVRAPEGATRALPGPQVRRASRHKKVSRGSLHEQMASVDEDLSEQLKYLVEDDDSQPGSLPTSRPPAHWKPKEAQYSSQEPPYLDAKWLTRASHAPW